MWLYPELCIFTNCNCYSDCTKGTLPFSTIAFGVNLHFSAKLGYCTNNRGTSSLFFTSVLQCWSNKVMAQTFLLALLSRVLEFTREFSVFPITLQIIWHIIFKVTCIHTTSRITKINNIHKFMLTRFYPTLDPSYYLN